MLKFFKTLRNNWKKSIFGVAVLAYGYNYGADKYETHQFMRAYCEEARKYGEKPSPLTAKPRHVTVILNPMAKNGKGKKLYEKFSDPLLHLAGLRISLIQTEQEGQARQIMEIMENTDAIVIAGGDGTLHEAVTGLLRREDEAFQKVPVGIAPIGKKNLFAKTYFSEPTFNEARVLAESTMAVIRELHQPVDIIKIQGETGKPVFSVNSIECGAFRDTNTIIEKYWYYGFLKDKIAYLISGVKEVPGNIELDVSYTPPCQGCSRCHQIKPKSTTQQETQPTRWWQAFIPKLPAKISGSVETKDYSKILNEECGIWQKDKFICSNFLLAINEEHQSKAIKLEVKHPLDGRIQFIKDGWTRHNPDPESVSKTLKMKDGNFEIHTTEGEERWISIDNEKYDKQNIQISLLTSKINISRFGDHFSKLT